MDAKYLPKPSKAAVSKPAGVMPRIHPESKTHYHLFAGPLEQMVRSGMKSRLSTPQKVLISKTHTNYTLFE